MESLWSSFGMPDFCMKCQAASWESIQLEYFHMGDFTTVLVSSIINVCFLANVTFRTETVAENSSSVDLLSNSGLIKTYRLKKFANRLDSQLHKQSLKELSKLPRLLVSPKKA